MKFYKLSGIGYPVKIHKFYILLFALCFYNIACNYSGRYAVLIL